jgi:hypothetical protein
MKAVALVLLVVFAFVASSLVVGLSTSQAVKEKVDSFGSYNIVQTGSNDTLPQGDPIDTPEMPG